jgi:5'-AMP-activated protein kinase catalytic alpha subunit
VRLGVEVRTSELVAIKVLERARISDADAARRLAAEIGILRLVEHSSLLRLLEVIEAAEATYLVTEHVGGGELFAHIDRVGHLAEADAAALFGQMLSAVHSLHELGVIHRDLKPENMLLLEGRAGGGLDEAGLAPELKIIDFGLGAILPSADDELLAACGSPHYAAPEMLIGTGYTGRRADLWSLGVCLYAMLCGVLPFDEDEPERLYDKIIAGQFGFDGCPPLSAEAVEMIRGTAARAAERKPREQRASERGRRAGRGGLGTTRVGEGL